MDTEQREAPSEARSQTGSAAVQRGGVGTEKTPASSDTPEKASTSTVSITGALFWYVWTSRRLHLIRRQDNSAQGPSSDKPEPYFATKTPGSESKVLEGLRKEYVHSSGKLRWKLTAKLY